MAKSERLRLLDDLFASVDQFFNASRVSAGQSCNTSMMEYLVPTDDVKRLWYALEALKDHDRNHGGDRP